MDNPAEYMLQFFNCEEREDGFDDNTLQGVRRCTILKRASTTC